MLNHTAEPLVSVIIPAFNSTGYIDKAIQSVLNQQVPLEILIIDDHSSDQLEDTLKQYEDLPEIRYYRNSHNMGPAASRNQGVSLARGKYVAFLDADDWWTDDKLEKQLARLKETGAVLCCTARELVSHSGRPTDKVIPVAEQVTYKMLLRHNSINCSSVVLLRSIAEEFPMEHEDAHEDYITWLRILRKYGFAVGINEPLLKYRLSRNSKSGSKLQSASMTFKVYRYMGFNIFRCCSCFISYALHGIIKYG